MKFKSTCLAIALICIAGLAYSQSYVGESLDISKFNKLIHQVVQNTSSISYAIDPNTGKLTITGNDELESTLEKIAGTVKANGSESGAGDPYNDNPPAPGNAVQPGAIPQPNANRRNNTGQPGAIQQPGVNRGNVNNNQRVVNPPVNEFTTEANDVQESDNDVLTELKFLAIITYDKTPGDYEKEELRKIFPKKFKYLDKILQAMEVYLKGLAVPAGTGQAKNGSSNFAFSESAIIIGITDWAIKRAKEELINVYLDDWYDRMKKDPVINPLIPQSLKVYEAFRLDNSVNLAKYGDKWKAAFQEDIRNIPVVFQDETYVEKVFTRVGLDVNNKLWSELIPVVAGGDEIVYNLYLKKHLVVVLSGMADRYNASEESSFPVFKRCVLMADILSRVCGSMDIDNNKYMPVSLSDVKALKDDGWKFLLKLVLLRDGRALKNAFDDNVPQFINDFVFNNTSSLAGRLSLLVEQTLTIVNAYQNILSNIHSQDNALSFDDVRKLFDLFGQFTENVTGYFGLSKKTEGFVNYYKINIKPFITYLSEVGEGISTKQYGKVLDGSIAIIKQIDDLKNPADNNKQLARTLADLQRYGSFMVNILTAKESEQVETALDELVPKGQYQLKNQRNFSVSLSLYPGIFGGMETIKKYQTDANGNSITTLPKKSSTKGSLAFYLPAGIDFNLGGQTRKNKQDFKDVESGKKDNPQLTKKYASYSFFIQVFDFGSVLNYRLTGSDEEDTDENSEPRFTFKQLFAPGVNAMFHFPNSPVVMGAGLNYNPGLRTITQGSNTYHVNALRYGIFAAVDVTALFFHISKK